MLFIYLSQVFCTVTAFRRGSPEQHSLPEDSKGFYAGIKVMFTTHWLGDIWKLWWRNINPDDHKQLCFAAHLEKMAFSLFIKQPETPLAPCACVDTEVPQRAKLPVLANVPWTALGVLWDGKTHLQTFQDAQLCCNWTRTNFYPCQALESRSWWR